ncbi:AtpZ/AtpI family protein [Alsobacter sp. R-9]
MGKAFRLSTEFMAGIIAGALMGYGLDSVAGTRPWGMIVFLMLGFGAGVWNVMRASGFVKPPSPPPGGGS